MTGAPRRPRIQPGNTTPVLPEVARHASAIQRLAVIAASPASLAEVRGFAADFLYKHGPEAERILATLNRYELLGGAR